MITLDTFKDTSKLIINDEHAEYVYNQSYGKIVDDNYDYLIERELAEERANEIKKIDQHAKYVENNYIKVGGN